MGRISTFAVCLALLTIEASCRPETPAPQCSPANCEGCCQGSICRSGKTTDACGPVSGACAICVGSQVCSASGRCEFVSAPILVDNLVVIPNETAATIVMSPDSLRLPAPGNDRLLRLAPDSFVATAFGAGFLRRVISATQQGGDIVLQTSKASLADVVVEGGLNATLDMSLAEKGALLAAINFDNTVLHEAPDGSKIVITKGSLDFTPKLDFGLNIKNHAIEDLHITLSGELTYNASLFAGLQGALSTSQKKTVWKSQPKLFIQFIGFVPVLETVTVFVDVGFDGSIEGKAGWTVGSVYAKSFSETVLYKGGAWSTQASDTPLQVTSIGPTFDSAATATAKFWVRPRVEVTVYEPGIEATASLGAEGNLKLKGTASPTNCKALDWSVSAGVDVKLGADLTVFDKNLAKYSATLYTKEVALTQGQYLNPNGSCPDAGVDAGSPDAGPDYEWTRWPVAASNYQASAGIVTDSVTGLKWQQALSASVYTWANANTYCAGLSLGGTGWRLPTLIELESIVDYGRFGPAIDPVAFPATAPAYFWSSSPSAHNTSNAWAVNFSAGGSSPVLDITTDTDRVRCVR